MAERARSTSSGDAVSEIRSTAHDVGLDDVANDVKGAASDLKAAALEQGRGLYENARKEATSFADRRKDDAAQSVADIASSLRETGRTFEDRPNIQAFVSGAADGLDQLASGLKDRSFADIYTDVEAYARRSPLVVGATAVAAGFLLARFIKASADNLSEASAEARSVARRAAAKAGAGDV